MIHITEETGLNALYGGWLLGGGGGGPLAGGRDVLKAALECGGFDIVTIDELDPAVTVVTGSLVGSPSAGRSEITPAHCVKAYELFRKNTDCEIGAFISNEAGAHSITNGWIAAAANKVPVIDAACNGRAHPTGVMGAMSLDTMKDYRTAQSACGGSGKTYIELFTTGGINQTSKLVRESSVQCEGFVSVLRNPACAAYVRENAAIGALSRCMEVGAVVRECEGDAEKMTRSLGEKFGLQVLAKGVTNSFELECVGGFDAGSVKIGDDHTVTFWNEYMTAEGNGKRLGTFPDLITLLDGRTGLPVCSADVRNGTDVILACIPKEKLLLGSTMKQKELFEACEEAIGKALIKYVF